MFLIFTSKLVKPLSRSNMDSHWKCQQPPPGLVLGGTGLAEHPQQAGFVRGLGDLGELCGGRGRLGGGDNGSGGEDVVAAQDAGPPPPVGDAAVPGQRPLPLEPGKRCVSQSKNIPAFRLFRKVFVPEKKSIPPPSRKCLQINRLNFEIQLGNKK